MKLVPVNPRRCRVTLIALAAAALACSSSTHPAAEVELDLQPVASGLASPVHVSAPPGDSRLFIVEQAGRIRIVKNGVLLAVPFLDITSRAKSGGEQGLLSVAFDPQYAATGQFYVYYTSQPNGDITVERYGGAVGADVALSTGTFIIGIPHPGATNHNGGMVTIGPDGMLYMATGDGGGGGDPNGNAQNLTSLLGKLLRLDVRSPPYAIPSDNPFFNQVNRRGEIWAYGLRNPWRFAFDRGTSPATLFIADVGQNRFEEIHVAAATAGGLNYGWNVMEGLHCYPSGDSCNKMGLQVSALEYDRSAGGCSITGGYVYRGTLMPALAGQYFYSDYCAGFIASMNGSASGGFTTRTWTTPDVGNVTSFGEDGARELYVTTAGGTVYRLQPK